MKMLCCFLAVFLLCPPVPGADASAAEKKEHKGYPGRYLLLESASRDRQSLSTPVAAYVNDAGVEVALIGAIHVAEPSYYARLNRLFQSYDVLLFEMIGGEGLRREEELRRNIDRSKPLGGLTLEEAREWNRIVAWRKKRVQEEKSFLLGLLGSAYRELSDALGLQTQHQGIDYSAPHLVHANMMLAEFRQAQARKGESLAGLVLKSALSSLVEKPRAYQPNEFGMMMDFLSGNKAGLKNELMRMFVYAPNDLEDTVILEGRNAKCMEVFDRWSRKGARNIGIFYGAAHLPGLHSPFWNAVTACGTCSGCRRGAPTKEWPGKRLTGTDALVVFSCRSGGWGRRLPVKCFSACPALLGACLRERRPPAAGICWIAG